MEAAGYPSMVSVSAYGGAHMHGGGQQAVSIDYLHQPLILDTAHEHRVGAGERISTQRFLYLRVLRRR